MSFYGQSLEIDWANNQVGIVTADFGDDLRYHYDGVSATLDAGESVIVGIFPMTDALSTDSLEISYVIECGPASNGSARFSAGLDPTWNLDDPTLASAGLGTHTIVGQQTLVLPTSSVTWADLDSGASEPIIFIEGISGTVEIQQVKLRVWPTGGPSGAWTAAPSVTVTGSDAAAYRPVEALGAESVIEQPSREIAAANALEAARGELAGSYDGSIRVADAISTGQFASVSLSVTGREFGLFEGVGPYTGLANMTQRWAYVEAAGFADATPSTPAGGGTDPREVPSEELSWVRDAAGVPVSRTFAGWDVELTVTAGVSTPPVGEPVDIVVAEVAKNTLPLVFVGGVFKRQVQFNAPPGGSSYTLSASGGVTNLVGGPYLIVSLRTTGIESGVPTLTAMGDSADSLSAAASFVVSADHFFYFVSFSNFEYFDPTLPWEGFDPALLPGEFLRAEQTITGAPGEARVRFTRQ